MKKEIVIDDYFPVLNGQLMFSQPNGNELWAIILEKAWCKMFKTFEIAEGGLPHVSLEYLTGAPSSSYSKQNYPEMWKG